MQKIFGYIRVSSMDQNIARQLNEMQELGIKERDIFIDKQSGKNFDRPQYKALKAILRQGDLLYIKSIDRFGRNSKEIKKEWEDITQNIAADIKVLDMPLLDTTQYKDLIGNFVSNLVLEVLSFVAQQERENIKQRQAEGIAIAKAKGTHMGRPKIDYPKAWESVYSEWTSGAITAVKAMELLKLKKSSFYKLIKEYKEVEDTKEKIAEIRLWISIENNNKFVRGKKKTRQMVEDYLKDYYGMKQPDKSTWNYLIYVKYTTVNGLNNTVCDLLQEIKFDAELNKCVIEFNARCDELNLSW